jgi:3-hydroxyisobutyrate dehydrogenase
MTEESMQIGFIGLGNMGAPMARNLAAAGHAVTGFDVANVTVEGVAPAATAAAAAAGRDAVITMLPDGRILAAVYREIVPAGRPGALLLDCSTVDVESARAAAGRAESAGLLAVDAPVSGGTAGAAAGTLTFMAGGSPEAFAAAGPLFDVMGRRAVHCGPAGAGQAAKICNNMILGISMLGVCESFALARKLGLDPHALYDVVSTSSGSCWSVNAYCPVPGVGPGSPADHGYEPGFAAELMLKDLGLSQQAAAAVGAATPLGAHAARLYERFVAEGGRGRDFSGVLPWLAEMRRSA